MHIDIELVGLIIGLFTALIGALVVLVRALSKSGETNAKINEAMIKQSDTNIALNNEIQQHSTERQAWHLERVKLESTLTDDRRRATEAAERLERQVTGLIMQLAQERTARTRQDGKVEMLIKQVEMLEAQNKELIAKVTALETENQQLRGEREILILKVDRLQSQLEAEICKNEGARSEQAAREPEPGEAKEDHAPEPSTETSEEKTNQ